MTNTWQVQLAHLAGDSLRQELELYPKAGLVSLVDNGSHCDMNHTTFLKSIAALDSYWLEMVELGQHGSAFAELVAGGKRAEQAMLEATAGINTHRGAIFILGIIVAATSYAYAQQQRLATIPDIICNLWGRDICAHRLNTSSHGSLMRKRYPEAAGDIIISAGTGFLPLFADYLPLLRSFFSENGKRAYLQVFYQILATTEDNNLLYRGGYSGLQFARQSARNFLLHGGVLQQNWYRKLEELHQQFVERNLSPGGCADLLAATIFLFKAERLLWD